MEPVFLDVLVVLLMVLANGLLSLSETAVVSARPAILEQMAGAGRWGAARALETAKDPNVFFSTVQVGITLVGVLSGAYGGATLAEPLARQLSRFEAVAPYAQTASLTLVVAGLTYLSIVAGELVPKRIAIRFAEPLASLATPPLHSLSLVLKPLVWLLDFSGDMVLKPFGMDETPERPVTAEELQAMARQGHKEGSIEKKEYEMVSRVFNLSDRTVGSVMTPRMRVEWLRLDMDPEELKTIAMLTPYSRFPVAEESLDEPMGVVNTRDLLSQIAAGGPVNLRAMTKPPLFLPENLNALDAMDKIRSSEVSMALVIDQYGSCCGVATMENLSSVLVDSLQNTGHERWVLDGLTSAHKVKEMLSLLELPGEEEEYNTLAGLCISVLGKIPRPGDQFDWEGYRFEVIAMDGNRVSRVRIARMPS
jgi:putative hemolysin